MKKKKKIIYIFILLIMILILLYYFINDNVKNNIFYDKIKNIFANVSGGIFYSDDNYKSDLINEINNDYKNEINNLREILNLNSLSTDRKYINASVIKRSANYWYDTVTINKGEKDGIKKGNAVINNNGLIGKVVKVYKNTSDVKLLISIKNNNYLSAMFKYKDKYYYGIISDYNVVTNRFIMKDVIGDFDKKELLRNNVVTSTVSNIYSSGLLIGKIKKIKKDSLGISNEVIVEPTVNFNNINVLSVVVGDSK